MRETEENGEALYSVSEAVQETGVPSHVLRYWEDELGLAIRRTSQGHRVYSEEDIVTFRKVKDLKEKGIQLKAIRLLFEDTQEGRQLSRLLGQDASGRQEETPAKQDDDIAGSSRMQDPDPGMDSQGAAGGAEYEIIPKAETGTWQLFEKMLRSLIGEAVAGQNERLEAELADLLRDEIENLYIQLRQDAGEREAAAAQMSGRTTTEHGLESLLRRLKRFSDRIFRQSG